MEGSAQGEDEDVGISHHRCDKGSSVECDRAVCRRKGGRSGW